MWYSKVGTKRRAVREGAGCYHLLYASGRDALIDQMIADAEKFLQKCITKHDLTLSMNSKEFDIKRFPPTSDNW